MKSYGGLYERVYSDDNLRIALKKAMRGKKERKDARLFAANADGELESISTDLKSGQYRPGAYNQFRIKDPKPRLISCASFRDRVVQHALCNVISPILDRRLIANTYACRKNKGTHRAALKAQELARKYRYYCKIDVSKFFDSVNHEILLKLLAELFREKRLLDVLDTIVRSPFPMQLPGKGLPIGNLTSQWFANYYLDGADHMITDEMAIPGYVRYMDDMLLFADTKQLLWEYVSVLAEWLRNERKLDIKHRALVLSQCKLGIPFLGCRIYPGMIRLRHANFQRILRLIRKRESEYNEGRISEQEMAASVRSSMANSQYYYINIGIDG